MPLKLINNGNQESVFDHSQYGFGDQDLEDVRMFRMICMFLVIQILNANSYCKPGCSYQASNGQNGVNGDNGGIYYK